MRHAMALGLAAAAIATATIAVAQVGAGDDWPRSGIDARASAHPAERNLLLVRGHVRRLYPGAERRMRVRLTNRAGDRLWVRGVRTVIRRGGPGCSAKNLRVPRYRGNISIGPRRTRVVRVRVAMRGNAPDACQGRRFKLRFHARARRS